ncbi:MAG: amidohydrolase family protein [Alistipes sp.]|nr:amidohydrolase family protein [Alistipes sp.]
MNRRIASHYALIDSHLERNIVVTVDDSGRITAIERVDNIDSCAGVEFYAGILIPAMVNAHSHLELAYLRGAIAEGSGFAGFARAIGQVRGGYTSEERIRAAEVADARMWEEGIAAVADIANDDLIMSIKERSKIEYHTMFEHFGINNNDVERLDMLAAQYPHSSVTPHSTYSVNDASYRRIATTGTAPLSIHFLESDDERALYRHEGSLWAWYERMGWECDFLDYGTPAARIVASTPRDRRVMLVHATRVSEADIVAIEAHFDIKPTWVVCPESNRYISRLTPPIELLRNMGCNIAIGTDSLASARSLSMVDNMRRLGDIPLAEVLTYATRGGARALGIDDRLGTIEVGKCPGLAILRDADLQSLRLTPETETYRII